MRRCRNRTWELTSAPFLMPIEDVFTITGRGTVVTGKVEQGIVKVPGMRWRSSGCVPRRRRCVPGVGDARCKILDQGQAGDNIGALLRGTKKEDVERGQVLCKPGSITPARTRPEAQVYVVLTKAEGDAGRRSSTTTVLSLYHFRTTDVTGMITLPEGTEMVMPGDNIQMTNEVGKPTPLEEAPPLSPLSA